MATHTIVWPWPKLGWLQPTLRRYYFAEVKRKTCDNGGHLRTARTAIGVDLKVSLSCIHPHAHAQDHPMPATTETSALALASEIESHVDLDTCKDLKAVLTAFPQVRRLWVAAAIRCLGARRSYFDRKTQTMQHEPDGATQLRAATLLAAYCDGLPVQASVNLTLDTRAEARAGLEEAIGNSPELRRLLQRTLNDAKPRRVAQVEAEAEAVEL
jgi:hypothetical protein